VSYGGESRPSDTIGRSRPKLNVEEIESGSKLLRRSPVNSEQIMCVCTCMMEMPSESGEISCRQRVTTLYTWTNFAVGSRMIPNISPKLYASALGLRLRNEDIEPSSPTGTW
jgi:hypothetical protein